MTQQPVDSAIQGIRAEALTAEAARYGALAARVMTGRKTARSEWAAYELGMCAGAAALDLLGRDDVGVR